jgi:phosphoglycolate phosphatase-like HAD superfamily hydrolase
MFRGKSSQIGFVTACATAALSLLALPSSRADAPQDPCGRGWVYFDLGNTLVNTADWDHLKYMPQAREYLRDLKASGFHLGLISNVPESWGATPEAKIAALKNEIAKTWSETDAFDWTVFDSVLLPPTNQDRKPAPYLFLEARGVAGHCKLAYEGEEAAEVKAATDAGFDRGIVVGTSADGSFFPAGDRIFQSP